MTSAPPLTRASARPGFSGGRLAEALLLVAVFVLVNIAGALFQRQITFNAGKAWEGEFYYDVAEQYAAGHWRVASEAPLVYRVGTPFLAALVERCFHPGSLFVCFKIVNLAANALALALLVCWLRRFLADWRVRTTLATVFLLQWDTPTRWLYFYPAHTDPWMWVFLLAGLLATERYRERPGTGRLLAVAALGALGVAFREVVFVVPVAFVFCFGPVRKILREGWRETVRQWPAFLPFLFPLFAGGAALLAVRLVARQTNTYSFALTALHFLYDKPLLVYLQSIFLAFGPLVWLPVFCWRQSGGFLARHESLAFYLAAFLLLGFIGGTDTERLLYWSMPVVYVLIGLAMQTLGARLLRPWWLAWVLPAAQLVAVRAVFWPIPDHPNRDPHRWPLFTPFGSRVDFMELFSFYQSHKVQFVSLMEYLLFGGGAVDVAPGCWRAVANKPAGHYTRFAKRRRLQLKPFRSDAPVSLPVLTARNTLTS